MVIEFTAAWCGPCKYMDPIIKDFAAKYIKVDFIKIDVDELMVLLHFYFILLLLLLILYLLIKGQHTIYTLYKDE